MKMLSLRRSFVFIMCHASVGLAQNAAELPYVFTTFAGTAGSQGSVDATGSNARFKVPDGLAIDGADNLYVTDTLDHTVRKITPTGVVTTVAGKSGETGSADGAPGVARFGGPVTQINPLVVIDRTGPSGITVAKDGTLYVTDGRNQTIRKIAINGTVSTLAGQPNYPGLTNGLGYGALFSDPSWLVVDAAGYVYVSDDGNDVIRVISPAGYVTTLLTPNGAPPLVAGAMTLDPAGRILQAFGSWSIRRVTLSPIPPAVTNGVLRMGEAAVETVAAQARNVGVGGVALAPDGTIFFLENSFGFIRQILPDGTIGTVGGSDTLGGYVDGFGPAARFAGIAGIVVDRAGAIFVTDAGNAVIRKATRGTYATFQRQPQGGVVNPGQSFTLSVAATGNPAPVFQWSKNGETISGATSPSLTLTDVRTSDAGDYTVTAGNAFSTFTSNVATVTVASVPLITAPPTNQTATAGQQVVLAVRATGATSYQWRKNCVPIPGATNSTLTILRAEPADAGSYTVVVGNGLGSITTGAVTLTVNFGRIVNLSILTSVSGAGDKFTMGYVVGGNATTGSKPLLIRAVGPSLGALGVPATLADPQFELFAGANKNGGNDNWGGSSELTTALATVGAFAFLGPASADAAAMANIASRDNSMVVSSASNGSGTVLAEIYDATPRDAFVAATPRLINVSVRKHLGTGLTAGFVLGGSASTKVLIRAVGPTLGGFGVPDVVADPQLTLFNDKSVKIGENNDWGGTAELTAAYAAVGAFVLPATSKDAALLVTLPPGLYSVQASGTGTTTGVALVEVYEVP